MPLYWERRGTGEPMLWITGFTISAGGLRAGAAAL